VGLFPIDATFFIRLEVDRLAAAWEELLKHLKLTSIDQILAADGARDIQAQQPLA
jgi:hypothetical protein